MEVFDMIEKLMNKLGYVKKSNYANKIIIPVGTREELILRTVFNAFNKKEDLFIDYVKKTNKQKFYVGKEKKLVLEV